MNEWMTLDLNPYRNLDFIQMLLLRVNDSSGSRGVGCDRVCGGDGGGFVCLRFGLAGSLRGGALSTEVGPADRR
jgi:hypothetical protein